MNDYWNCTISIKLHLVGGCLSNLFEILFLLHNLFGWPLDKYVAINTSDYHHTVQENYIDYPFNLYWINFESFKFCLHLWEFCIAFPFSTRRVFVQIVFLSKVEFMMNLSDVLLKLLKLIWRWVMAWNLEWLWVLL